MYQKNRNSIEIYIIVLILFAILIFGSSIYEYFSLDDTFYIKIVQNKTVKDFPYFFTHSINPQTYRPFSTYIYFFFMSRIFNSNPFYYHLVNFVIYTINSLLVFFIANKITKNIKLSFIIAFLYSTRSALTMAIFWISGGQEIIMMFFLLFSFFWFLNGKKIISIICFCISF
jgi:4-amino-4-deoxy-L-arabinose transferase-like glycosyltransferase